MQSAFTQAPQPPGRAFVTQPRYHPGAASRDPLEWLAGCLPLPLLLLALPFVLVWMMTFALYVGLRTAFWDMAFGLSVFIGFVWFFLDYFGIA